MCYHEIFVLSNDGTHKISLSFSLPLSLLFCSFWIITRKLHLRDNPNSKPMETGSWCTWTKLEGKGVSGEEFQEDKKDNGWQKSNSPSFSPSLNFQAKNILSASSRWRENGLSAISLPLFTVWVALDKFLSHLFSGIFICKKMIAKTCWDAHTCQALLWGLHSHRLV